MRNEAELLERVARDLAGDVWDSVPQFRVHRSPVPKVLYHYTSATGLHGILSSGTLRATNVSYLNDASEGIHGVDLADALLDDIMEDTGEQCRAIWASLRERLRELRAASDYYVACFCDARDRLGQWRAYGSTGGRFAIGFDLSGGLPSAMPHQLGQVLYGTQDKWNVIRSILWTQSVKEAFYGGPRPGTNKGRTFLLELCSILAARIHKETCFFKHEGFTEEQEWRAVHHSTDVNAIRFDVSNARCVPVVDIWSVSASGRARLPIKEVWVGPSSEPALAERTAGLLLRRFGYEDVRILTSDTPLRG